MTRHSATKIILFLILSLAASTAAFGQEIKEPLSLSKGGRVEISNPFGRVLVRAREDEKPMLSAVSPNGVQASDIKISGGKITASPADRTKRIDLVVTLPLRCRVQITTRDGEIAIDGNFAEVKAETTTGTISTDIPAGSVEYEMRWTASRPRVVADFPLEAVKEKSAGQFVISGRSGVKAKRKEKADDAEAAVPTATSLKFTTVRGIVLLNVPPNEVGSDLRERPLTNAAKAIIRSGDSLLMEAIRRAAPQYYGEYVSSLPPMKRVPSLGTAQTKTAAEGSILKTATIRIVDAQNRAVSGLSASDLVITESGEERPILNFETTEAPFDLVLLMDVSGSVENYLTFIRKAARSFIETADKKDRIAIVLFNEDVKVLSGFTTDKDALSHSLDSFDAGGGTAFYDALAYTLADVLRPLKGGRTAIVLLTDGEDNSSFLAFDSLIGSIQESGTIIYPLYVPTGLIQEEMLAKKDIDPMRRRYMSLTKRSEDEGERLAKVSGGVFFPISRLSQIDTAYDDIVKQLRGAYSVTFRSDSEGFGASPKLRVRVKKDGAFAAVLSVKPAVKTESEVPTQ